MKSEDRRLPRPIGGERAWKNSGTGLGGNMSNLTPFSTLDCLDSSQLPQPISLQQQTQQHHGQGATSWIGSVYSVSAPQQQYPGVNQQQQPSQHSNVNTVHGPHTQQPRADARNFLGRRFMDDVDQNRVMELQQVSYQYLVLSFLPIKVKGLKVLLSSKL
jgi:hypothetical protein